MLLTVIFSRRALNSISILVLIIMLQSQNKHQLYLQAEGKVSFWAVYMKILRSGQAKSATRQSCHLGFFFFFCLFCFHFTVASLLFTDAFLKLLFELSPSHWSSAFRLVLKNAYPQVFFFLLQPGADISCQYFWPLQVIYDYFLGLLPIISGVNY